MPITAESIANEPIVVIHYLDPLTSAEVSDPHHAGNVAVEEQLKQHPLVIRLMDFSKQRTGNFGTLAAGMASDPHLRDPRVKSILIGTDELAKLAVQAISTQPQYGQIPTKLFTSLDEALKEAYSLLASK